MTTHAVVPSGVLIPVVVGFLFEVGQYFVQNQAELVMHTREHAIIVIRALVIAVPLGVTLGTVITYDDRLKL